MWLYYGKDYFSITYQFYSGYIETNQYWEKISILATDAICIGTSLLITCIYIRGVWEQCVSLY